MFKKLFVTLLLFLSASVVAAQEKFHAPDKVYLQLDRNLYAQGDTIWLKGYAMHRASNTPSENSYAIHVQMLDEDGQQVGYHKMLIVNGEATGQIELFSLMKPGYYQLVAHTSYMKNFDQRFFFRTTIEVREKVRNRSIQTTFNKNAYQFGDTAELNFTVIDGYRNAVGGARFVYEYMQGDKVLKKGSVHCDDDGTMAVKLPLSQDITIKESPQLRFSYFAYDGANHRMVQKQSIPLSIPSLKVVFFPEGGDLIEGLQGKVAFKAFDNNGEVIAVKGELLKDGEVLSQLTTVHDGMGLFGLLPESSSYAFRVTSPMMGDSLFYLPEVKKEGFVLSYQGQDEDNVNLSLRHNYSQNQTCKLWISYCDSLLEVHQLRVDSVVSIPLSKEDLPNGIVTFTVSDEQGVPQAERLVYVEQDYPTMEIMTNKTSYEQREQVVMTVELDEPNVTRLSYAVVDSVLGISARSSRSSIRAYAELESELKGFIPNANQYLGDDRNTAVKRDLLLMTHGWRHFEWMDRRDSLSSIQLQDYNRVDGCVTRFGKPYRKSDIVVLDLGNIESYESFKTDKMGCFSFTPEYLVRRDKNLMVVANAKKVNLYLKVSLENTDTIGLGQIVRNSSISLLPEAPKPVDVPENSPFMLYDAYELQEVEVSANKRDWDMERYLNYASDMMLGTDLDDFDTFEYLLYQVSNRLLLESDGNMQGASALADRTIVKTNIYDRTDIINYVTGESAISIELSIYFNQSNPRAAMIYLNDHSLGHELSNLDFLRKEDIAAIAIIDGAKGYDRFGIEAYYGAVMVYTYSKDILKKRNLNMNRVLFGNFIKARQFPEQLYSAEDVAGTIGYDNRVTLHWQPFLHTDLDGQASSSFYTGDVLGKKEIIVQGFDDEGNLYYQKASFEVKEKIDP